MATFILQYSPSGLDDPVIPIFVPSLPGATFSVFRKGPIRGKFVIDGADFIECGSNGVEIAYELFAKFEAESDDSAKAIASAVVVAIRASLPPEAAELIAPKFVLLAIG